MDSFRLPSEGGGRFDTLLGASLESAGRARRAAAQGHRVRLAKTPALLVSSTQIAAAERGQARTHEEDLPAQEARPEAGTRLPRSHGFEGWSPRACASSGEGAREAQRLRATRREVPPLEMLRRKADFDLISRHGTVRSSRLLVLRTMRTSGSRTRVGLSTPRTLGGAVQRNRVRRRLRDLLREQLNATEGGLDLLLIARSEAGTATYSELREALRSLLERSGIGG